MYIFPECSIGQDTYRGNPWQPVTQNLYAYAGNNPINYIDPTGHNAEALTLGQYVHWQIAIRFMNMWPLASGGGLGLAEVTNQGGRADLVGYTPGIMNPTKVEVYDVKSISYYNNGSLNAEAHDQLQGYISALREVPTNMEAAVVEGTTFNPNGMVIDHPTDSTKQIKVVTHYNTDPGLIFYDVVDKLAKQPEPAPKPVDVSTSTMVAVGVGLAISVAIGMRGGGGRRFAM